MYSYIKGGSRYGSRGLPVVTEGVGGGGDLFYELLMALNFL